MDVSVIIPTHNRRDWVLRAIDALLRQDYPADSYEVIISCDRCTDGTVEAIQARFDNNFIRVIRSPIPGKVGALNSGLRLARGRLAIFLDDEVEVDATLVSAHVHAYAREPGTKLAVVGYSRVDVPAGAPPLTRHLAKFYADFFESLDERQRQGERNTPMDLCGSNFSMPVAELHQVGAFNEGLFFLMDDFELGLRLLQRGYDFRFCRLASAKMNIALDPDTLVERAADQARNDLQLSHDYPSCIPYLIFHRKTDDPRRWHRRVWWTAGRVGVAMLALTRKVARNNLRLMHWEYSARYYTQLRHEIGSWNQFLRISQAPDVRRENLERDEPQKA